jgi:hypothetical protein
VAYRGKRIGMGKLDTRRGLVEIFADDDSTEHLFCLTSRDEWLYVSRSRVTFIRNVR